MASYPERIICLTEESVETLFHLGEEHRIVGVSAYVERPVEAKKIKKVSAFTSANIGKILELKPDLVLGFSDIQKDIARDLIGAGINVYFANHRSLEEILNYILCLGSLVGKKEEALELISTLEKNLLKASEFSKTLSRKPRVYIEEWDEPMISGIKWFSELIEACGGVDIFSQKSQQSLAPDRIVSNKDVISSNPDFIFGCWCGKKVDIDQIKSREGYLNIEAVKNNRVFELDPAIFLQPGPAPFIDGIPKIINFFKDFK
ncbi:MAG: iron complex transport system substrate-binding protein [Bacteriovoracaceae bacterium]|jgi:iron complex transport system substrate-binding protein